MKKLKSRKAKKKQRQEWTYVRTVGEVSEISLQVDQSTGDVTFVTPVEDMYSEVSYERTKGPKVLTKIPLPGPILQTKPDEAFTKNFDAFVAVDTNTRSIQDQIVSVTGIVLGLHAIDPTDGAAAVAWEIPYCLEFVNIVGFPERVGWVMSICQLRKDKFLPAAGRIALVVDSDLAALASFNARKAPIADNFFLPDGIEIVYASSDVGREYCANKLLHAADQVAGFVLDDLMAGKVPLNRNNIQGFPFKAFRIITDRKQMDG